MKFILMLRNCETGSVRRIQSYNNAGDAYRALATLWKEMNISSPYSPFSAYINAEEVEDSQFTF